MGAGSQTVNAAVNDSALAAYLGKSSVTITFLPT